MDLSAPMEPTLKLRTSVTTGELPQRMLPVLEMTTQSVDRYTYSVEGSPQIQPGVRIPLFQSRILFGTPGISTLIAHRVIKSIEHNVVIRSNKRDCVPEMEHPGDGRQLFDTYRHSENAFIFEADFSITSSVYDPMTRIFADLPLGDDCEYWLVVFDRILKTKRNHLDMPRYMLS